VAIADAAPDPPELVRAMLEPGLYGGAVRSVELRETHISWVFLAGDRAYKVKKPVVFPFLDYGTLQRRHRMCREEVRLNRRLAPRIYLGVVAIARRGDRYSLTPEGDPQAVEYAVEMRRVDEERSMAALIARGELGRAQLAAVAARLARFHAEAPEAPVERRRPGALLDALSENLATLRKAGSAILARERLDAAERFSGGFVAARRGELEARARRGLVRDCHGDLRAEHVILPPGGDLYVYDCVEFNPDLRQIDVATDIAFLVMDLARLGAEGPAGELIDDYRRAGGDPGDDALASFLASYRAWVRAKVACLRSLELAASDPERAAREAEARQLLDLGHRFAWRARRPLLVAISGLAGTGKTTLAGRLAELSGWAHISSDPTRKRLAGLRPTERAGDEHYTPRMTMRTYAEIGRRAAAELARNGGAIVDATFHRAAARAAFREGLGDAGTRLLLVECTAPAEVLFERARRRQLRPDRVSDAGVAVIRRQQAELEPTAPGWAAARLELSTEAPVERLAAEVEAFIDRTLWERDEAPDEAGRR
jgi:aminoglycoside phosphotransferase family enzyme/predicted kinase